MRPRCFAVEHDELVSGGERLVIEVRTSRHAGDWDVERVAGLRAPFVGAFGKETSARSEVIPGLQSSLSLGMLDSESQPVCSADSGSNDINGASRRRALEWKR